MKRRLLQIVGWIFHADLTDYVSDNDEHIKAVWTRR